MTKKLVLVALFALQMTAVSSVASVSTPADQSLPTCYPCSSIVDTKAAPAKASLSSAPSDQSLPTCYPCGS
jgi:hypothetical protein